MTDAQPALPADDSSARVIRALLDYRSIWTTHDLVEFSQAPALEVRRIVDDLQAKSLVERRRGGIIGVPDWARLLNHWAAASAASAVPTARRWKATRSLGELFGRIAESPTRYSLTGVHAAAFWTAAPTDAPAIIYTPDAQAAATAWDLAPTPTGTVILVEPATDVVYLRRRSTPTCLRLAAPAQVLADLLADPSKHSTHAANLLTTWMHDHLFEWRY